MLSSYLFFNFYAHLRMYTYHVCVCLCVCCVCTYIYNPFTCFTSSASTKTGLPYRQTRFLNRFASSALRVERPLVALALPWSPKSVPSQLPVISGVIIVVRAWLKNISFTRTTGFAIVSPKKPKCVCVCRCLCVCVWCTKRIYTRRRRNNEIISE